MQYFYQLFRGNFRVIHVIRDGRDVATGANQMQFGSLCAVAGGIDTAFRPHRLARGEREREWTGGVSFLWSGLATLLRSALCVFFSSIFFLSFFSFSLCAG